MLCSIVPPDLLLDLGVDARQLEQASVIRTQRTLLAAAQRSLNLRLTLDEEAPGLLRTIYDAGHGSFGSLPGVKVRGEHDPATTDEAVNDAFDNAGRTYAFYKEIFDRDSMDDRGMELVSSVHFETDHNNAYWNGFQMIYGDGDGEVFLRGCFPKLLDVVAHELTHGVTDFTAGLVYSKQPGALNESFSDVMGALATQYALGQTADQADWLIGKGCFGPAIAGEALRSMKQPGSAHPHDRQPAHMRDYLDLPDDGDPRNDHGGVHLNSGIPNHAFYLAATALGGYAWERAGRIWYVTLTERLGPVSQFDDVVEATVAVAGELYQADSDEQKAVRSAWQQVGLLP
ncbi:M4 family metallopeptidase [Nonomuraea soli]|uniref:Neutral metalloproteinase n=1 Tax=Nonomuraea soli TaxID=1032476 RepID=A0A7W0HNH3_9ACTN|nr:M4 family metallopeptidase [Nonomuraea soli]MBA2889824.1 Zn-dependent metalloprotease [Nonomuraea soli]